MADAGADAALDRECVAYSRYLIGQAPSEYVIGKYREAHARDALPRDSLPGLDPLLGAVARAHSLGAWLVDAYTAVFFKRAQVRRKWVLLVAILETSAPAADHFDAPDPGGRAALAARLAWRGAGLLLALALATPLFLPPHLLAAGSGRRSRG